MRISTYLASLFMLFSFSIQAQNFPYNFSTQQGIYEDLVNPIILTPNIWDDPQLVVDIGFGFEFYGSIYNSISISEASTGGGLVLANDINDDKHVLLPYGSDIIDRGYNSGESLSFIAYELVGTEGNRILKIEWNNVGFYEELNQTGNTPSFVNFQLWLHESSNNIEVHFGEASIEQFSLVHDLGGVAVGMILNYDFSDYPEDYWGLSGEASNPNLVYEDDILNNFPLIENTPSSGTIYRFSTFPVSTQNILTDNIKLYPTLVTNNFTVTIENDSYFSMLITDLNGIPLLSKNNLMPNTQVDISSFSAGLYFVQLHNEHQIVTKKILKVIHK